MINLRHVSINVIGAVLPIAIIFFSVPAYLHIIGPDKYAVLSIVWLIFGYLGILDFGLSRAVTHAISRIGRQTQAGKAEIIWSACAVNLVLSLGLALLLAVIFAVFAGTSANPIYKAVLPSLPWMALGLPLLTVSASLNGALDGEERFKQANAIQIFGAAIYQLAPLAVAATISQDIATLIDTVIACRLVVFIVYSVVAFRCFALARNIRLSVSVIRDLVSYGFSISLINFIDPLLNRIDQLVLAHYFNLKTVAAYNISANAVSRLNVIPLALSRSLFPKFSAMPLDEYRQDLFKTNDRVMVIWMIICAVGIGLSGFLFQIWLRSDIAPMVSLISNVLIVGVWANTLTYMPYTALQATGRSKSILQAHLWELPAYLGLMIGLILWVGPVGAAIAWSCRVTIDYFVLWHMCGGPPAMQRKFAVCLVVLIVVCAVSCFSNQANCHPYGLDGAPHSANRPWNSICI